MLFVRETAVRRAVELAAALCGLGAALTNCAFIFRPLSNSRLDPLNSFISELEVPGQPSSGFFRYASLLSGVLAALFAVGLLLRVPRGRQGVAASVALALFGVTGAADALVPMDCAPSASAVCFRAEVASPSGWAMSAHTWFDVAGTVSLLAALWLFGRHLAGHPHWRRSAEVSRALAAVLAALSLLLTVMSVWYLPGIGLVQRLVVVGTSLALVVLAADLVRAGAPSAAQAARSSAASGATTGPVPGRRGWQELAARVIGGVVTLAAAWSVLSVVLPGSVRQAGEDVFGAVNLPVGANLFSVALLILLSGTLRRRLRLALWTVVAFQAIGLADAAVSVGIGATHGTRALLARFAETDRADLAFSAAAAAVLIPLLVMTRSAFPARLYPAARRPAAVVLVAGLAVSATSAVMLTWLHPGTLRLAGDRIQWALRAVVGVDAARMDTHGVAHHGPHWIASLAGLISGVALVAAIAIFLRAARDKRVMDAQDELDLRVLLRHAGGRDSLGYFATRRDKSVVFAPSRRAAVTHRVLASVSLASGDPIGAPEDWGPAIHAWLDEARAYGWYPAVLGAGEEAARAYVSAGLRALPLGDEAVVDLDRHLPRSPQLRAVRRAVTRVSRAGYRIRVVRHGDLTAGELDEMARCAEAWRGAEPERGFSMALNRLGDPTDDRCVAVLATDGEGRLRGLQSYVPWGTDGLSLDLMRRDDAAVNGVTEALIAALLEQCPDLGIGRVSLNFAVLRTVFDAAERVGAGPLVRTGNAALVFASRFWQLQTLYRTTARYQPRWVPRYLLFDSALTFPRVAIAAGMAEGFLPAPRVAAQHQRAGEVTWQGTPGVPFREAVGALDQLPAALPADRRRFSPEERARRDALALIAAAGMDPYPVSVPRTVTAGELRRQFGTVAPGERTGARESVTGRVRALRDFGGLVFAELHDQGDRIQAMVSRDLVGDGPLDLWRRAVHLGDHVSVTGQVIVSNQGELSIMVGSWAMAAKCLEPVPAARERLADPETRVRRRHLDLIVDPEAAETVRARGRVLAAVRDVLGRRAFDEVETPVLQRVHGGAAARPFVTTINAYGLPLYLRIAPELYLKRLAVGGMQRVYELGRNFRNEGADATHNPEFTALEAYQAWADYEVMRELARDLVLAAAVAVHGRPIAHRRAPDGTLTNHDLSAPWPVIPVHEAVSKATGAVLTSDTPPEDVHDLCRAHGVRVPPRATAGQAVVALYDALVEPHTTEPTFYTDFPVETSPLTRAHRDDPRLAERWDLVAFGMELGTAYSELVDPLEQRRRLTEQSLRAAAGDAEAMQLDEDFLRALEYGMPPTGGLGMGVDRLVMLLTGGSIRSTLTFPFVRPERSP